MWQNREILSPKTDVIIKNAKKEALSIKKEEIQLQNKHATSIITPTQ